MPEESKQPIEATAPRPYANRTSVLSTALHEAAVPYILSEWERSERIIEDNLAKLRARTRGPLALRWLEEWEAAWRSGPEDLAALALLEGEHGDDLRQMTPLAGVLPFDVRAEVTANLRRVS